MSRCVIRTFTGREVNPLELRVEDIDPRDMGHALALCNRFAGHTRRPIPVAQHVVYVARLLAGTGYDFHGLHHDDPEAYLGDITKWLKATDAMRGYRDAEDRAEAVIAEALNIVWTPEAREAVDWADRVMVRFEGLQGFGPSFKILGSEGGEHPRYPALTDDELEKIGAWKPWSWRVAEEAYLTAHRCWLTGVTEGSPFPLSAALAAPSRPIGRRGAGK